MAKQSHKLETAKSLVGPRRLTTTVLWRQPMVGIGMYVKF